MKKTIMFVKNSSDITKEQFFEAHEKAFKSLIPEGYVLPDWEDESIIFNWSLIKEAKDYELWDLHAHLHKMGDLEHDYVLHYPSNKWSVDKVTDSVSYHCIYDPNFLCIGWGSKHYIDQSGKLVYEDQYVCAQEGVKYNNICTIEGLPKTLREAIGNFFAKTPNGEVHDLSDEHYKRIRIDFFEK